MPTKANPTTIVLKGAGLRKERAAGGVITPGYLVELDSSNEFVAHSTAAGNHISAFAIENELFGLGIDDDYAATDQVLVEYLQRGAEVYALLPAAADAIVIGDYLESAGDGTLQLAATAAATTEAERHSIVGRALQAVDNSVGGTEVRIKVELV